MNRFAWISMALTAIILVGCQENNSKPVQNQETSEVEKQKEKAVEQPIEEVVFSDQLPKLYDQLTEKMLDYAKSESKGLIALEEVGGDLKYKRKTSPYGTLYFKSFTHSGVSDIQINLESLNGRMNDEVNEEMALKIAHFYLDKPGFNDNVVLKDSYALEAEEKNTHKVIVYSLKEDVEEFIRNTIYIMIEEENGKPIALRISHDTPRWILSYKKNGYVKKEWVPLQLLS